MRHTVVWKPAAEQELAGIWNEAADRVAVTAAANTIDRLLRTSPRDQGESRSGITRIMFVYPLGVIYDAQQQDRLVSVLRVWRVL
ncbi:MAG: hypothetical protein HQ567_33420 [Candidatus Nealsonbacteria bacterium]|nr:hypothetical protein [Candidatus Nealsonbacteria bacterium]